MKQIKNIYQAFWHEISFFLISPALMWQMLFLIIPLFFVVTLSFLYSDQIGFFRFTLDHYKDLLQTSYFLIILRSLALAFSTALLCLLFGYALAYYIVFRLKRLKLVALYLLIVPFMTNLLVLVYSWFFILEPQGFLNKVLISIGLIDHPIMLFNSLYAVQIVMFYCFLPFMVLPLVSSLEKLDTSLIEASYDLGATVFQTFLRVILPQSFSGIQAGFFLVFVPAFGEFAIPALVGGDKFMFVGSLISHYFLVAKNNSMGAAFTCLSAVVLAVCVFLLSKALNKIFLQVFSSVKQRRKISVKTKQEQPINLKLNRGAK